MKVQEQDGVGEQKGRVQGAAFAVARLRTGPAREQHEDAVVLSAVMPGAPGKVERENQGNARYQNARPLTPAPQQREVHGEDAVLVEIFGAMVGAVNCRHVVRIVKEEG